MPNRLPRLAASSSVFLLLLTIAAGPLGASAPRWSPAGPPAAPIESQLLFDPGAGSHAYAVSPAGVWGSRNGGVSWTSVQPGLGFQPVAFTFDPHRAGRLYAVRAEADSTASILRSDDFGARWNVVFRKADYTSAVYRQEILVDPVVPDTLYWIADYTLRRSLDGGRSWHCFPKADECFADANDATTLVIPADSPRRIYVVGNGPEFKVLTTGGRILSSTYMQGASFAPDALVVTRSPRTLYAWVRSPFYRGALAPCFLRSDDDGTTWKEYMRGSNCGAPAVDVDDPLTVRMVVKRAGETRLRISSDGGESWADGGAVPEMGDLYVTPDKELVLATGRGLYRAPGAAGPWRPSNRGFMAAEITAILPSGRALLAAPAIPSIGLAPEVSLLRSEDAGRSWNRASLVNATSLAVDPNDPLHLVASALRFDGYLLHSRVLESRDGGETWRGVVDPAIDPPNFLAMGIDSADSSILYAGTLLRGFHRSADGGRTWQESNAGLPYKPRCYHYYCVTNRVPTILPDVRKGGRVTIHFELGVFVSEDGGLNWSNRSPLAPKKGSVYQLARDPQGALLAVGSGLSGNDAASLGVVYRSTDEGATWTRLGRLPRRPLVGPVVSVTAVAAAGNRLFVGTNFLGVLSSADGGATWKPFNDGLPLNAVTSLAGDPSNPGRLYATVPQNGVYMIETP